MRKSNGTRRRKMGIALMLAGVLAAQPPVSALGAEENIKVSPGEVSANTEDLPEILLDENGFPDERLREALGELADQDGNGILEEKEYTEITSLDLAHREIRSLKGLEIFPNLRELDCSWNHLTREEVEPFLKIEKITYYNNTFLAAPGEKEVLETMPFPEEEENSPGEEAVPPVPEEVPVEEELTGEETSFEPEAPEAWETKEESPVEPMVVEELEEIPEEMPSQPVIVEEAEEIPGEMPSQPVILEEAEESSEEVPSQPVILEEAEESSEEMPSQPVILEEAEESSEEVPSQPVIPKEAEESSEEMPSNPVLPEEAEESSQEEEKEESVKPEDSSKAEYTSSWGFTFVSGVSSSEIEEVPLDEKHFPDELFREFLGRTYDRDGDLLLSEEEIQGITSLYLRDMKISDLGGIGYFKNLLLLDVTANQLETLDTEDLVQLRGLYCRENHIGNLDLTHNQKLLQLECDENVKIRKEEESGESQSQKEPLAQKPKPVTVGKTGITKITNPDKGKIKISYKKVSKVKGYQIQLSKDKKFKSSVRKFTTTKTSQEITRLYDEWVYYVRVRAYKMKGEKRVYGPFSPVKSYRVKDGLLIIEPSVKAAPIKSVSLISKKTVRVEATAPDVVRSQDKYYYLFNMTAAETKLPASREPIAKTDKETHVTFQVPVNYDTQDSRLFHQYAVGVRTGEDKYQLVSGMEFISNPEKLAISHRDFPQSVTKKGLQVNEFYISDAAKLGVKHTTYNMCLDDMIAREDQKNETEGIPFTYNGKTYWFNRGVIESYDARMETFRENQMIVSAIILLRYRPDLTYLMPSGYYQSGFYGLSVKKKAAREHLEAVFTFLARRYAADGQIANWIIGNEVNNYTTYHYTGSNSLEKNAKIYADAFRVAYIAIRSVYSKARLYISLDHLWNTVTSTGHASRAFLEEFAREWDSYGNFNIAYHPYPSPLTAPEFWENTNNQVNHTLDSPCVNMGNLEVLTNYVETQFGRDTRIILSEQGFTSYKYGTIVEENQAAAIAYAYYLAEFNPMIDAFMLHRHIDHQAEINQGLALGLWTNKEGTIETPGKKKYAWEIYKYVDTEKGADKTAFALPIIGKGSWEMAVPGYDPARFS